MFTYFFEFCLQNITTPATWKYSYATRHDGYASSFHKHIFYEKRNFYRRIWFKIRYYHTNYLEVKKMN